MLPNSFTYSKPAFQPKNWVVAFFVMFFVVPTMISLYVSKTAAGYGSLLYTGSKSAFVSAFLIATMFILVAYFSSFLVVGSCSAKGKDLEYVSVNQIRVGWLMFIFGIFPTIYLASQFTGESRSVLVSGFTGQMAFALSNSLIVGYMCLAMGFLQREKYFNTMLITIFFGFLLFLLGGRGRVVLPILAVFVTYIVVKYDRLPVNTIIFLLIAVFIVGALLDPIFTILYRGGESNFFELFSFSNSLNEIFILRRNFDGIHNFFVIQHFDEIPYSLSYLMYGPREAFMGTYFPEILARGVGFPATIPGTFWMVGGFAGLFLGAIFYGFVLGCLTRLYFRTKGTLGLGFQYYLFMLALNPAWSFFDNAAKIFAVIIMILPFYFLPKVLPKKRPMEYH